MVKGENSQPAAALKKKEMEELAKKKYLKLLLILMCPKDEVLQVFPLVIAQAIYLAFNAKIVEPLNLILSNKGKPKHLQFTPET